MTAEQRQLNLESFEYVWAKINDGYWDPQFGGIDWQAAHDELRPQADRAATMAEARAVCRDMISRLGLSHFAIIPSEVYEKLADPARRDSREGATGIDVRVIDGHALAYRAFFATSHSPNIMATARGEWTNAVYVFLNKLLQVWREEQPEYIVVAFDVGETFRHEQYPEYKANRAKTPPVSWNFHLGFRVVRIIE